MTAPRDCKREMRGRNMNYDRVMEAIKIMEKCNIENKFQREIEKLLRKSFEAGYSHCANKILKIIRP
jgi:uncharacterized protein YehS (DUF1456 family)